MQENNVCMFIPTNNHPNDIHIIHFVLETKKQIFNGWKSLAFYRMHVVLNGEGVLHTHNGEHRLHKGDVFFCLPACPFAIQSIKEFKYSYVGFLGKEANKLIDELKINVNNCVFTNLESVAQIWENAIKLPSETSNLFSKGVVYFTFAQMMAKNIPTLSKKKEYNTASLIKKYIDENFSDANLSLDSICKNLSYNPKYTSAIFKSEFKITFKEYLNIIRINNACALMQKGFTGIKDIASLCGFNDALYFSKVFKKKMQITPTNYLVELSNQIR